MKNAISYLRVSTEKQGATGLGIDAQRAIVATWEAHTGIKVIKEFIEVESGRKAVRKQLSQAMAMADRLQLTLVVAKLDRLSRDVDMIRRVCGSNIAVVFCDFPQIPEGPIGKFMLTMLAAVAEFEAGLIGKRTKEALAALKARGVQLGNPNGAAALQRYHATRDKPHDQSRAVAAARIARQRKRDMQQVEP